MTGVRGIVFRDAYRGRMLYGRTRWIDRGGTKVKVAAPERDWLTVDAPELRIVSETLWTAAHARLARTRQTYVVGGRLGGRPEAGIESRHLLEGFVRLRTCQGSMHAIKRTSRRGAPQVYYVCNGWRVNGTCTNRWSLPLPDLDAAVLGRPRGGRADPGSDRRRGRPGRRALGRAARGPRDATASAGAQTSARSSASSGASPTPSPRRASPSQPPRRGSGRSERRRTELLAQLEHLDGLGRAARPGMTRSSGDTPHAPDGLGDAPCAAIRSRRGRSCASSWSGGSC